ncbi:MAG: dihydroxy-acid dehydratase [Burkholderiales bacterium]|nr:dihydroxy-acid dehydratase [Burkholderiales bacterium]
MPAFQDPESSVPRKLRSNFEPGTPRWAARRAQWRSLGLTDADMDKPKIAVVNSSSELATCFTHLDGVAAKVKEAIRAAGGLPFEIRTAAPSDFITSSGRGGRYILAARDLIVNDIEVAVEGALLDGMLCLASCDKTTPGQLMAAGRLDLPALVVPCGYQASGRWKGEHVDLEEVFLKSSYVASGQVSMEDLVGMTENAVLGPGVCAGMGTANSMHIACEALGMCLPGAAPVAANSPKMFEDVRRAGERIVQMVWEDLKPRHILSAGAFANATRVSLALSSSINVVKHLQAIAVEAGCDVDVYALFERLSAEVPLLAAIRPNGERLIEDLEAAGGARAVMKQLERTLDLSVRTVTGRTLGEDLRGAAVADPEVVRPLERPLSRRASIVIMRGNLAPEGAIVRLGGEGERMTRFSGPAIIYHSREEAIAGLARGEIRAGHVVVMNGLGLRGSPGMAMTSALIFGLDGAGLLDSVAVVTDGQMSGLVNRGLIVGEVSPEAAYGGPFGLVENGDTVTIDVQRRVVNLEVPEAVLAARRAQPDRVPAIEERGWLSIYERNVQPLSKGAVLLKKV